MTVVMPDDATVMPAYAAVWVRAHVWTQAMRTAIEIPVCACELGPTQHCLHGDHHRCHRATPQPFCHGYITDRDGRVPLDTTTAQVWLADRTCAWVCPCDCHTAPAPEPARPKAKRKRKPKPPPPVTASRDVDDVPLPDSLFDLEDA